MEHKNEAMQSSENSGSKTDRSAETAAGNEIVPEEAIGASTTAKGSGLGHVAAGMLLNIDTPKALEQLAKVFGYALIAAVPNVLFAIATSYFPFTRWTTEIGVPTIDNTAYAAWHLTLFSGSAAFCTAFNCASYAPEDFDNRAMGWHSFFPCLVSCWIALDVFCFLTFCLRKFLDYTCRERFKSKTKANFNNDRIFRAHFMARISTFLSRQLRTWLWKGEPGLRHV